MILNIKDMAQVEQDLRQKLEADIRKACLEFCRKADFAGFDIRQISPALAATLLCTTVEFVAKTTVATPEEFGAAMGEAYRLVKGGDQ
jgi:hypothetical protein